VEAPGSNPGIPTRYDCGANGPAELAVVG
jgi:hypothetical protein